jgi:hypothetical protein
MSDGDQKPHDTGTLQACRLTGGAEKEPLFQDGKFESVLGTAAKILISQKHAMPASILANAKSSLTFSNHDNWNGGQDTWLLYLAIPTDTYLELKDREDTQRVIDHAIAIPMRVLSDKDFINVEITADIDHDPDWRRKTNQMLSGEGITNQGRVRSDNIAVFEHDGLRFRSRQEILFYQAMKSTGVPFAPLPVVLQGGIQYQRLEPDFVIVRQGIVMVVEIDGDTFHNEKPADAHARLKFLGDEGVVVERIKATACDTPDKAREAARNVIASLNRQKAAR